MVQDWSWVSYDVTECMLRSPQEGGAKLCPVHLSALSAANLVKVDLTPVGNMPVRTGIRGRSVNRESSLLWSSENEVSFSLGRLVAY